jgi:hypothetical protein
MASVQHSIARQSHANLWLYRAVRQCCLSSCAENHMRHVRAVLGREHTWQRMNWPHARITIAVVVISIAAISIIGGF